MNSWPETRQTLLLRLHDLSDQKAWNEFSELYGPLIRRVAQRRGLQDSDAADISQRVLLSVANAIAELDLKQRGSFRGWLAKITTNAALNLLERDAKHKGIGGDDIAALLERVPAPSQELSALWNQERQLQLFRQAAGKVRRTVEADSWAIFKRTTVSAEPLQAVAADTGKSLGSIYALRCRIMRKLRDEAARLEHRDSDASYPHPLS